MGDALQRTGADLELAVHPHLRFGMFFKIPNEESGFGNPDPGWWHPWVIVVSYQPGLRAVVACPRTTQAQVQAEGRALWTPGGIVPGLDKDGLVLLFKRQLFPVGNFRSPAYARLGCLSEEWQARLHAALAPYQQTLARMVTDS